MPLLTHQADLGIDVSQFFCEAEPELAERVTQVVDAMEARGLQPSSSVVLAFLLMGAALLMRQQYGREEVRLLFDGVLPMAESVSDQLTPFK